jgi:hypothetical protein
LSYTACGYRVWLVTLDFGVGDETRGDAHNHAGKKKLLYMYVLANGKISGQQAAVCERRAPTLLWMGQSFCFFSFGKAHVSPFFVTTVYNFWFYVHPSHSVSSARIKTQRGRRSLRWAGHSPRIQTHTSYSPRPPPPVLPLFPLSHFSVVYLLHYRCSTICSSCRSVDFIEHIAS